MAKNNQSVSWQAEEYITHTHDIWWYVGLFIVAAILISISIWQGWWSFTLLIVLSIIAILVSNLKPPRKISYTLDSAGLTENKTLHKFEEFRAFGISKEKSHYFAVLLPKKKLNLSVKVYFPEGSGEAIVDLLGARLPMEEIKPDFLDKIVNFLRI